jgi:pimeloyl-ACP methyl ester carboxylesterase
MFVREYTGVAPSRTLLWIHGLGADGTGFGPIVRHPLLSGCRHIVPDLPGYGRSPRGIGPLCLEGYARHLAEWLGERSLPPVALAGHSMGGVVGQLLAEEHPSLIEAFVNVEGNISPGDCTVSAAAAAQTLEDFLAHGFEAMLDGVRMGGEKEVSLRVYHESLSLCDPRAYHLNARELVEMSGREDLALRQAALPVPSWYVAGVPGGAAPRSLELLQIAGVPTERICPSGHCPFIDRPEDFARAISSMLGEPPP